MSDECSEAGESKSVVTSEHFIGVLLFMSLCFSFWRIGLFYGNHSMIFHYSCFAATFLKASKGEEVWIDTWQQWVRFDKITDSLWWSLQHLSCFFCLLFSLCRSAHFHGVTVRRALLMDYIVEHFRSTNVTKSKMWWERISLWLLKRS